MIINIKHKYLLGIIVTGIIIFGIIYKLLMSSSITTPPIYNVKPTELKDLSDGINTFAFDLYRYYEDNEDNIFFSPFSIESALAIVYEGAGGKTKKEMKDVLHLPDDSKQEFKYINEILNRMNTLSVANALWINKDNKIYDTYINLVKQYYNAEIERLDMNNAPESVKIINHWVSDKTKDKIKEIIKNNDIDSSTVLVITNAIYFKDFWLYPFDKDNTQKGEFYINKDKYIEVEMMEMYPENKKFNYWENKDLQVIELPYKNKKLSMIIFLPKEYDISIAEKYLNKKDFTRIIEELKPETISFILLPKFKFETSYKLKNTLMDMGMISAFTNANFSFMSPEEGLLISKVIHKAYIDVNEEGTEAAAATAVIVEKSMPVGYAFIANHPFIFFIIDKTTHTILFMGRVMEPRY